MVTIEDLRMRVVERYSRLALPTWPDPHPDRADVGEEEYSRVTEGERYRIAAVRARTWAEVLREELGAREEPVPPSSDPEAPYDRGVRLTSPHTGTLPLLLLEADRDSVCVVTVGVVEPGVEVTRQPDCGCDACDSGSDDLLAAVDKAVVAVVEGPYVVLRGRGWVSQWHPGGGAGSCAPEADAVEFEQARQLGERLADEPGTRVPDGVEVFIGQSWLG